MLNKAHAQHAHRRASQQLPARATPKKVLSRTKDNSNTCESAEDELHDSLQALDDNKNRFNQLP
jgi:hypothetical protein